ncbi:hypothetical protein KDA06_03230 [Candidatus Saccharibacteria bacterium]|nr:hypothetical protein [Candidatus Saccharibacteria bacterium]
MVRELHSQKLILYWQKKSDLYCNRFAFFRRRSAGRSLCNVFHATELLLDDQETT